MPVQNVGLDPDTFNLIMLVFAALGVVQHGMAFAKSKRRQHLAAILGWLVFVGAVAVLKFDRHIAIAMWIASLLIVLVFKEPLGRLLFGKDPET